MDNAIKCFFTLGGLNYKNGFVTSCPQSPNQLWNSEKGLLPSQIFNSINFKKHRLEMMSGKWSFGCHLCRDPEKIGTHSMRQDYIATTDHYNEENGEVSFDGLKTIEFRFSNSCNMACKHCSVVYSSGWVSKLKNYIPDEQDEYHDLKQLLQTEHRESEWDEGELGISISKTKEICDDLNKNFNYLEKIEFAGGEVLAQKQFIPTLRFLHEHPNVENMSVSFHTNFNANFDPIELANVLKPYKHTLIHISVDCGKNLYPYFRTGNWDTLKNNIDLFKKESKFTQLGLVCTTSIYQMFDFKDIFMSFLELDIDTVDYSLVFSPQYLNPSLIAVEFEKEVMNDINETKEFLDKELEKRLANFSQTKKLRSWKPRMARFNDIHRAKRAVEEIENYVLKNKIDSKYWENFLIYLGKTDKIWKQNFNDYKFKYKFVNNRIVRR